MNILQDLVEISAFCLTFQPSKISALIFHQFYLVLFRVGCINCTSLRDWGNVATEWWPEYELEWVAPDLESVLKFALNMSHWYIKKEWTGNEPNFILFCKYCSCSCCGFQPVECIVFNIVEWLQSTFKFWALINGIAAYIIGNTFCVLVQVSAILFVCSIDIGIGNTFSHMFWHYSIPILLSAGALVKFVSNNITVTESVKARTVSVHLK